MSKDIKKCTDYMNDETAKNKNTDESIPQKYAEVLKKRGS